MPGTAVVVTGAGGALGSALVRELVRGPSTVVAVGHGLDEAKLASEYGQGRVRAAAFDVTSRADWALLLEHLTAEGLVVSGAVLAAGAYRGGERLHEATNDDAWTAMLGANLETARVSLQALLPGLVARRAGSVVVIGSMAAVRPWQSARAAAYAASKAAVLALAQALAAEVIDDDVRVNVVLPSTLDTAANRAGMPDADFSRWVAPASLAGVVSFLLSDAARDISGAALPVYGKSGA